MNLPSPIQQLHDSLFENKGIEVYAKRDDLIDSLISGNKWRKLKFNFEKAKAEGYKRLLTFGGAYSNHIAATARAGDELGFPTIGVIRGDELNERSNATLQKAASDGMELHFISREDYRLRGEKYFQEQLRNQFPFSYLVPEGGANFYGMLGCTEILKEIDFQASHMLTAAGTGTTASGLLYGSKELKVIAVSALKNGGFLRDEIKNLLFYAGIPQENISDYLQRLSLQTDFHFGGYANQNEELIDFMNEFYKQHNIPTDAVYTGKAFYAFYQLLKANYFEAGSKVILLHTGGLQGNTELKDKLLFD